MVRILTGFHNVTMADAWRKLEQLIAKRPTSKIEGQMTLPVNPTGPKKKRSTTKSVPQPASPVQKLRQQAAYDAIATGKKDIPLRCAFCHSASLQDEPALTRSKKDEPRTEMDMLLNCVTCGRTTRMSTAKAQRRRDVKAFVAKGIDVDLTPKGRRTAT
jgi:hypothetical protein